MLVSTSPRSDKEIGQILSSKFDGSSYPGLLFQNNFKRPGTVAGSASGFHFNGCGSAA